MANLLTVGMPVYNAMPYLRETMESLLAQTAHNFEILAIADGSTDASVEYLESIRDPRFRMLIQPNRGVALTRNRMLRETNTPWLACLDSDDVAYPNRIKRLLEYIARYPDVGMFYSLAEYHPKEECVGRFRCTRGTPEQLRSIVRSGYLLSFCQSTVVLHAQKTLAIGGYNADLPVEDIDLWWRMALHYDIQFIPEVLVGYRQHSSSLTTQKQRRFHVDALYNQYRLLSDLYGWQPQPMEKVSELLSSLASERELRAKEKLRELNMRLAQKKVLSAVNAALQSFMTSPSYFLKRLAEEFRYAKPITNGVNPQMYLQRKAELWPCAVSSEVS